jgi:glycosyltransferase involved in cell wall biosynthesis
MSLRTICKKLLIKSPLLIKKNLIAAYENFHYCISFIKELYYYGYIKNTKTNHGPIKNILIYHISGLNFGGTEKNLQVIANALSSTYNVYYTYSESTNTSRKNLLSKKVTLLPFTHTARAITFPFFIYGLSKHIKNYINENNIDLIITAGSGYAEYPLITIRKTPIILINIFGSPTLQKNILKNIFISKTVMDFSAKYIGHFKKDVVLPIPTQTPIFEETRVEEIRALIDYKDSDFVFGRIGRDSNEIFDDIGIRAFQKIVKKYKNAKYIIMSPPPILKEIVNKENIPNIFFLPSSSQERDIWGFHRSLDCLAHFRKDGETFGLNIAESMLVGNPIISHKSPIWNAHVEYLLDDFSRVTKIGDIESYSNYMEEFIQIKEKNLETWEKMRCSAKEYADEHFSEKSYSKNINQIIENINHEK